MEVKNYKIPVAKSMGNLHGVCSGDGNMAIYPTGKPTASEPVMVHHLKRSSWLYGRFQRKLVNESLGTFVSLQKTMEDCKCDAILLRKSREYRSMMQACVGEINAYLKDHEDHRGVSSSEEIDTLKEDSVLLYKMELILGLIEVIFFQQQEGHFLVDHLLTWVRLHFPQCRKNVSEALEMDSPHTHPQFWNTCYGLVLQGLVMEARALLSQHPDHNTDEFVSMDELLRKMPVLQQFAGSSQMDFQVRWLHWKNECENRLEKQEFASRPQLHKICQIVCGKEEVLCELMDVADSWYHVLVSHLLYTNPCVMPHRLLPTAHHILSLLNIHVQDGSLDQLILHIMQANPDQVLKSCNSVLNNLWFSSHLADLFYHSLASKKSHDDKQVQLLRESLVLDYSLELIGHASLWQVAVKYLDYCQNGYVASQMILERIPLTSDCKAFKVLEVLKEKKMFPLAKSVCRVMARQSIQRDQWASAVWWSVRSQDSALTSYLADKILRHYMEVGEFHSGTLLDSLGQAIPLSDTLTFLGKYREFHVIYQDGDVKNAAHLLVSLITSKMAPKYFWEVLLEDALPLLQLEHPAISSEQTYDLLYCLQDYKFNNCLQQSDGETRDFESQIRLALTTNLSRAIIQEGTLKSLF